MNRFQFWPTVLLAALCARVSCHAEGIPPEQQVRRWHGMAEGVYLYAHVPVVLANGEHAMLVETKFPQRGRNFSPAVVLIRPGLKQAREIKGIGGSKFVTLQPEPDGRTFVALDEVASGQGTVEGRKILFSFDGWRPVIVLKNEFRDNLGSCGFVRGEDRCYAREVDWKFIDVNADGRVDMVETVTLKSGLAGRKLATDSMTVTQYVYHRGSFVAKRR